MFNFWLFTSLVGVTASIKKEFWLPHGRGIHWGVLDTFSEKLCYVSQIINVCVQKQNQKWKAITLLYAWACEFYGYATVHEMMKSNNPDFWFMY